MGRILKCLRGIIKETPSKMILMGKHLHHWWIAANIIPYHLANLKSIHRMILFQKGFKFTNPWILLRESETINIYCLLSFLIKRTSILTNIKTTNRESTMSKWTCTQATVTTIRINRYIKKHPKEAVWLNTMKIERTTTTIRDQIIKKAIKIKCTITIFILKMESASMIIIKLMMIIKTTTNNNIIRQMFNPMDQVVTIATMEEKPI